MRWIRISFILVFLSITILLLCNCVVLSTKEDSTLNNSETGYPSGEIQHQYLFCQGTRYIYNGDIWKDQNELTEVGTVLKVDNERLPDEEWEASHLSIGQKIYIRTTDTAKKIYIKRQNKDDYEIFIPDTGE